MGAGGWKGAKEPSQGFQSWLLKKGLTGVLQGHGNLFLDKHIMCLMFLFGRGGGLVLKRKPPYWGSPKDALAATGCVFVRGRIWGRGGGFEGRPRLKSVFGVPELFNTCPRFVFEQPPSRESRESVSVQISCSLRTLLFLLFVTGSFCRDRTLVNEGIQTNV